jgi:GT2 family glycosyltransferase
MTPTVTIGFSPRERFVTAAESLASLYDHTPLPFELLVVDAATPPRYLAQMRAVLDAHDNWRMLSSDRHLLPAAAKNLVLAHATGDYLCLVENDNLFTNGWLEALVAACEEFPADVACPLIREGRGATEHFDRRLGSLVRRDAAQGAWEIVPLAGPRNTVERRTRVDFVEQHCLLFRRSVFERIGPFDEELNTRDEIDLSLALHHAGATVVLEPRSVVNYIPPSERPAEDELEFYRMRWDLDRAVESRERIRRRWDLVETPGDLGFVRYRNLIPTLPAVRADLERLAGDGGPIVLVDDGDWMGSEVTAGLPIEHFPSHDGVFWGFPDTGEDALRHLDEAVQSGATHLVVAWPGFWWLDELPELRTAIDRLGPPVLHDDRLRVYALDAPLPTAAGGDA